MLDFLVFILVAGWGGVLSVMDWRTRRLPNWLTVGGFAVALLVRLVYGGWGGVLDGFATGMAAGLFLFIPFLLRAAGGGDVKMLAAAGAMAGWVRLLPLLWFVALAGLVLALVLLAARRVNRARLAHAVRCVWDWRYDRRAGAAALPPKESAAARVPFSIAIAVGLLLAM